jgi:hypothetical protein
VLSFCHFTFIIAHACTSFLSLSLTSSLCCAFLIKRHATSVVFLNLLCFDEIITSFYLCALIECVRQSVTLNPVFGQMQEALIHLSESNQVNLTVLVLFVGCHAQGLYTHKQIARLFIFNATCWKFHHCGQSFGSGVVMAKVYLFNDDVLEEFTPYGDHSKSNGEI